MADPLFATPEEEEKAGIRPVADASADDLFATEEEEIAAGLRDAPEPEETLLPKGPILQPPIQHAPVEDGVVGDLLAGLGSTLNLDRGMVRTLNTLGLIEDDTAKDTLSRLDHEEKQRGAGYTAGKLAGEVAAGLAVPGSSTLRGAMGVGALEGAISEAGRTGKAEDTIKGATGGALGGAAGHGVAKLLGSAGRSFLANTPKGKLAEETAEAVSRNRANYKALSEMTEIPASQVVGDSFEEMLESVSPRVRKLAAKGPSAVSKAAEQGLLSPQDVSDLAVLMSRQSSQVAKAGGWKDMSFAATGHTLKGLDGEFQNPVGALSRKVHPLVEGRWGGFGRALQKDRSLLPKAVTSRIPQRAKDFLDVGPNVHPLSVLGGVGGVHAGQFWNEHEGGTAHAQYEPVGFLDAIEAEQQENPTPLDDTRPESFHAMVSAYDSPALQAYPGLAKELSTMLQGWTMGEEPDPSEVALMQYRLSEVPGLNWAELDPMRQVEED